MGRADRVLKVGSGDPVVLSRVHITPMVSSRPVAVVDQPPT
jgi:hypothetical protein